MSQGVPHCAHGERGGRGGGGGRSGAKLAVGEGLAGAALACVEHGLRCARRRVVCCVLVLCVGGSVRDLP